MNLCITADSWVAQLNPFFDACRQQAILQKRQCLWQSEIILYEDLASASSPYLDGANQLHIQLCLSVQASAISKAVRHLTWAIRKHTVML